MKSEVHLEEHRRTARYRPVLNNVKSHTWVTDKNKHLINERYFLS